MFVSEAKILNETHFLDVHRPGEQPMLSDLFSGHSWSMNITRRFPREGNPPPGTPFRIEVEVETRFVAPGMYVRGSGFHSGGCLDATIVARGVYGANRNRIIAIGQAVTSAINGCRGKTSMTFDTGFRPGPNDWMKFQLYSGRKSVADVESSEPIAESVEMTLNSGEKESRETGLIHEETAGSINQITSGLTSGITGFADHTRRITRNVAVVAAVGGAIYFLWPHRRLINKKIKSALS